MPEDKKGEGIHFEHIGRLIDVPDELKEDMGIKMITVVSPKYYKVGVVCDNGITRTLDFMDGEKEIHMGIESDFNRTYREIAGELIDAYFEKKGQKPPKVDKVSLHHWYFRKYPDGIIAKGIVSGHPRLTDSTFITTSLVRNIEMGEAELLVQTINTLYHLPLESCNFRKQDKDPKALEGYEEIKEKYQGLIVDPTIEDGKVLLVLSNYDSYYFHSGYLKDPEEGVPREFSGHAHIGTFQDSYLINDDKYEIDIRYFPHYENIEFYSENTGERPLFVDNIGTRTLYVQASCGIIRLDPKERKEVCKGNAEDDAPPLAGGDLYPAGVAW